MKFLYQVLIRGGHYGFGLADGFWAFDIAVLASAVATYVGFIYPVDSWWSL